MKHISSKTHVSPLNISYMNEYTASHRIAKNAA